MLYVLVFARLRSEFDGWASRHGTLLSKRIDFSVVALIEEQLSESEVAGLRSDLCVSGESYVNRIRCLSSFLHVNDYVVVCAADDQLVCFDPYANDGLTLHAVWQPTCFFGSKAQPALSNVIFSQPEQRVGANARITRFFQFPFPGDNSIYYGMFKFEVWWEAFSWSASAAGGFEKVENFHAFDWLWMSRVVYLAQPCSPSPGFVIRRGENSFEKYHDRSSYIERDFVRGNPLMPLIRVLTREYPGSNLSPHLFLWFVAKVRERCSITGEKLPLSEELYDLFLKALD